MKAFLDTEFTNFRNRKLISIGIVTEDGSHKFYAEISDNYIIEECSQFVQSLVLPKLDAKKVEITDIHNVYALMTQKQCTLTLERWFESINSTNIVICSDAPEFDWAFLKDLLKGCWPSNLNENCLSLYDEVKTTTQDEKCRNYMMWQIVQSIEPHHALSDAMQLAKAWHTIFSDV
jgi:hypothetical protein